MSGGAPLTADVKRDAKMLVAFTPKERARLQAWAGHRQLAAVARKLLLAEMRRTPEGPSDDLLK